MASALAGRLLAGIAVCLFVLETTLVAGHSEMNPPDHHEHVEHDHSRGHEKHHHAEEHESGNEDGHHHHKHHEGEEEHLSEHHAAGGHEGHEHDEHCTRHDVHHRGHTHSNGGTVKMGLSREAYISAFLMSVFSFVGVVLLLFLQMPALEGVAKYTCLAFAGSILVADALMHLMPHALEGKDHEGISEVGMYAVVGALGLLVVEQFCHLLEYDHEHGIKAYGKANLIVEMLHNFIDGLAIGLAFLDSKESGIMISWAVAAHELPQELGDFMVLRSAGYGTVSLLAWNFAASLTCLLGVFVVDVIGHDATKRIEQNVMALTGGSFLTLALNMIVPQVFVLIDARHPHGIGRWAARLICLLIAGSAVYVMLLVGKMEADHHDHHDHHHIHGGGGHHHGHAHLEM